MDNYLPTPANSVADRILSEALNGSVEDQYQLAMLLETGEGVEQNYALACGWYQKAAQRGHLNATYRLGLLYLKPPLKDFSQALYWLTEATDQGHPSARFSLSLMYEQGLGLTPNHETSLELCRQAASMGCSEASEKLDSMNRWLSSCEIEKPKPQAPDSKFKAELDAAAVNKRKNSGEHGKSSFLNRKS